eukprot:CAMPEP_0114514852 /NCGR_PEP_ID=MMETSP0109-20121206/16389_1 /TAXON_ID=29199 /ORGANISM="Chlorarachnion reptans, Strain CCCM449" /LENGTH=284 /DNA_ID=CAMNT_0001694949 /DNA_START=78 /DNA_END=929 /DNA_ORIENTATION=-
MTLGSNAKTSQKVFNVRPPREPPLVSLGTSSRIRSAPGKAEVMEPRHQLRIHEMGHDAGEGIAVKNDVFLPSDESEHSGSDSDPSLKKVCARTCPSCLQRIRQSGKDYHLHLFSCLRGRSEAKECKGKQTAGKNAKKLLNQLKSMISKLDLTFRINTMESLRRIAENTDSPNIMFPHLRKEEIDNKILSLVYGKQVNNASQLVLKTPAVSQPKKRKRGIKVPLHAGKRVRRVSTKSFDAAKNGVANHTPPASSAGKVFRKFSPMALEDLFLLPAHARVPQSSEW